MDRVLAQVEQLLSRRTYTSPELREKAKAALLKTLRPIEAIKSFEDDELAFENAPGDYRYDDSDGVALTTEEELNARQQEKKDAMRITAREMFSDDTNEDGFSSTAGGTAVAEAVEINRKLKWGYTALHFAALSGDEAECDRLLGLGADKSVKDNSGKQAWQKADFKGFTELAEKLRP